MVKFFIKQRDAMDCGPACLAMVVKHYGRHPDLEQIREDCALGKEGVSLLGISKAAEKSGVHSLGGRITFETLANEAPLPCIAHWDQNHFVAVYKVKKLRKGNFETFSRAKVSKYVFWYSVVVTKTRKIAVKLGFTTIFPLF